MGGRGAKRAGSDGPAEVYFRMAGIHKARNCGKAQVGGCFFGGKVASCLAADGYGNEFVGEGLKLSAT